MPRGKIDYVVSFSSEDPEHPASNLLLREVSKKKWLCKKGETSCSVVLQLPRSVKITGVHIGAYHAALVEVLVGRSETSSEQFQVLVPSSVFLSREESRRDAPVLRVRSFGVVALSAPARDQRWDRVRLVCSQPHNKHAQFGLSFVHVDEEEGAAGAAHARLLALDSQSSDEDDFKPGELFAKHRQSAGAAGEPHTSANTGAQIRQATSQALKNIAESSTKLMKTPISKPSARHSHSPSRSLGDRSLGDRARDELLYSRHDAAPHARIDQVLARHQHENTDKIKDDAKTKDDGKTKNDAKTKDITKTDVKINHESQIKNKSKTKDEPKKTPRRNDRDSPPRAPRYHDNPTADHNKEARKRRRSGSHEQAGPHEAGPLLAGAALVLSGYQHPRRAHVRGLALALGARVLRDWGPDATHLICAFPNTPKLRAVRSAGGDVPVVRAEWLEQLSAHRRLLPWRWYATERHQRLPPRPELLHDDPQPRPELHDDPQPRPELHDDPQPRPELHDDPQPRPELHDDPQPRPELHDDPQPRPGLHDDPQPRPELHDDPQPDTRQHTQRDPDSGDDTDDEIEKVLLAQKKKRRLAESTTNDDAYTRADSPAASDADYGGSTDEEGPGPLGGWPGGSAGGPLPDCFDGVTFALCAGPQSAQQMSRYVRAYGGEVRAMSEVAEGSAVDYIVRGPGGSLPVRQGPGGSLPVRQGPGGSLPVRQGPGGSLPVRHGPGGTLVPAEWLARCHAAGALLPHDTLTNVS